MMRPLILAAPLLTVLASGAWGHQPWQPGLIGGDPPDFECGTMGCVWNAPLGPDGDFIIADPPRPGRTYTPAEIDRMRGIARLEAEKLACPNHQCASFGVWDVLTELRLQTYIAAGISPEALETEGKKP